MSNQKRTRRYLALMLIGFFPSLAGCLYDVHLKADADVESEVPTKDQEIDPSEEPKEEEKSPDIS